MKSINKYTVFYSTDFKRNVKKLIKRGIDISGLEKIIARLANDEILEPRYCDHPLTGDFEGCRECHVKNDLLLIYSKNKKCMQLLCLRTGTHSDLFK